MSSLEVAADKMAIMDVVYKYCRAIDRLDRELLESVFHEDSIPIYIDKRSESLKLIQRLRNEAHRFGITHHRSKRSKNAFKSELLEIDGIGEKTAKELLKTFYSLERIKELSEDQLSAVVSKSQAKAIVVYFAAEE